MARTRLATKQPKKQISRTLPSSKGIHPSIKERLGYPFEMADREILKDWKQRLGRVCKPCWELKYCPYGPLVEQSPLLPPLRDGMIEQIEYFKKCIDTGLLGQTRELDAETRADYEEWLRDEDILIHQVLHQLRDQERVAAASKSEDPIEEFLEGPLPPIEVYRAPYDVKHTQLTLADIPKHIRKIVRAKLAQRKRELRAALKSGVDDYRRPLDAVRRSWFQQRIREFQSDDYPQHIPPAFSEGSCNIFGHICPVFFSAEAISETSTSRRRGRYIPFKVKVRVVRRDNYTCQHCGAHLRDDEVEFDHKIPISKGGSSEEHNIRLTCFDCNRDKKDNIEL